MMKIRPSAARGHADHGWLDSHHSFSFAGYHDPAHMGFRALRVINEDRVAPGQGFGTHPHRDMEIISYVLEGALAHRDSMGSGSTLVPGEVQHMSAGTGVTHSEFNPSPDAPVHFLQIWLMPDRAGLRPRYAQRSFPEAQKRARLCLVASPNGEDGSLEINADAKLYATILAPGEQVGLALAPARHAWVQVLRGAVDMQGTTLHAGDGAALSQEHTLALTGIERAEVLVFDLA